MGTALVLALEAFGVVALVFGVLRLARRFEIVRRVRLALVSAVVLVGIVAIEERLDHPGRDSLSTAALAALTLIAVHVLLQLGDHVVWERFLKPGHISVPRLLFDVLNFLVLAGVGLALLKTFYSVNLTGFLVTSTVLSAIIGLSLQDVLTSVMSGIALQIESPIAVREWIRVGDKEGQVVQMNWRTITLNARDGHHVVLPNARIAKEDLVNYSRPTPLELIHVVVGVAYSHPPGEVKAVIEASISDAPGVCASPPAEVLVGRFADSAIEYDVRFFIRDFDRLLHIRDAVHSRMWYALRRAGFGIAFPQREVAVRQVSDSHDDQQTEKQRQASFAVLRGVETFRPLTDEQVESLARNARMERYTGGETLVRQGDEGRSLFVIKSGEVRVDWTDDVGLAKELARLGPGAFFGEMSLLTGEPRAASVTATRELEVAVVDQQAFAAVILADPRLVQALSEGLERRSQEVSSLASTRSQAGPSRSVIDSGTFFTKIQRFFRIEG